MMQSDKLVINAKSKAKKPFVILGLPDVGLVGSIAVTYLIEELDMDEIGYIDSAVFHSLIIVQNGIVKKPIRIYEKDDIITIVSDVPITPLLSMDFSTVLIQWIKELDAKAVINITGINVPNRISIDKPEIFVLATDYNINNIDSKPFNNGFIMGTYASIIKECINNNIPSITLLAESYPNFPDPIASISALEKVNLITNINVSLERLDRESEMIRLKVRELMKHAESAITRSKVEPSIYG
ncbi:MAG: PAC2 family protein [Candidatus Nitrosocaldaceae archaeon]